MATIVGCLMLTPIFTYVLNMYYLVWFGLVLWHINHFISFNAETVFYTYHHHHVMPPARIFQTLSRHSTLSFIASGRSSGQHPVSSQTCCMYVRPGRSAFAWLYEGVHRRTSLMSSSLLLHQCPACLVRLSWIVFMMGGRWPYTWCFVGCCFQDLFKIDCSILV